MIVSPMNTFNLLNEKENNLPVSPNKIPSMIIDMIVFVPVKFMVFLIATENFSNPRLWDVNAAIYADANAGSSAS